MTASELRQKFFDFFRGKGHAIIPSASLIPKEDSTVLFTTAGMHPLVPYLLGEKHPAGKRLVSVQKCIRTDDIEEIGDNTHLTFFEMLGNWSLGDSSTTLGAGYFKKEAIEWSWEFLTDKKWLGVAPEKLFVTVFAGDEDAPRDEESIKIWQGQFKKAGIEANVGERIFPLPKKDNWWGPAGQTGPCGPCTEMFYDMGGSQCSGRCRPGCSCRKYVEIWNDVFMEFNKTADNRYEKLKQKNVDTGMGVERTIAVINNLDNVYETELFKPIIEAIKSQIPNPKFQTNPNDQNSKLQTRSIRIIADHLKAATFILGDENGIAPSNVEGGYVLRRLIRRAIRFGKIIGIGEMFTFKIAEGVIKIYREAYPELQKNKEFIINQLYKEEEKFKGALERGLKEFEKTVSSKHLTINNIIQGEAIFRLYDTYGFPVEMTKELAQERGLRIDEEGFKKAFEKHQEKSRAGAERKFKGGLVDHSEKTTRLHTATHLLLAALRLVLGPYVLQKGSNITAERLRFDFNHDKKLTSEELKKVENIVNEQIQKDLPVVAEEMSLEDAKKKGALGIFEAKYEGRVKVYSIQASSGQVFSKEICGGPHVGRTGKLGRFRIVKEEASSAGVRRIKAVLE